MNAMNNPLAVKDHEELVLNFLQAMEQRDLDLAETMISSGFVMEFPGSGKMTSFAELIVWAKERYQYVKKNMEDVSVAVKEDATAIVYCHGTLYGRWLDDREFENVRFIDRFEIRNGLIVKQDVWNDLALSNSENNE